ncbi:MAG TPA: SRPBCC domain-containing protein [Burkholderiaceae bacterium]|nr:SRPBCC domain-containing protein [Burkholderiaceae bacterium]
MNAPEIFELQMSRHILAPRDRVCDAFLSAEALRQWMCPRGMSVAESSADVRVGGKWSVTMRARDGTQFAVGGEYREITRPAKVAFTWQWTTGPMPGQQTLVEVDFAEHDGGTLVQMRHSGFPAAAARDAHRQGWNATLNHLTEVLDPRGSAATLTLLGDPRSTFTRTVLMGLAEKGVAATLQRCAPHTPEILAVHPFGRIPALRDGEFALFETSAILRYIDESFDGPALMPATIADRARCEQWVSATSAYIYDTMIRRFVLQYIFPRGEGGRPDAGVIAGAIKEMPAQLAALDAACKRSDFLAGPTVSMADLFVAPILAYVEAMPEGKELLAAAPNLMRSQAKLRERPSFAATQPPRD